MGYVSVCSINCLPDDLLVQILSFLPTKQAALTSLLSKRWRTLFAFAHNLDFDNSIFLDPRYGLEHRVDIQKRFDDFVDRTLALQDGYNKIKKFSLTLSRTYKDEHHDFDRWICYALEHGVSELHLDITPIFWDFAIPSKVFTSTTLVKLSLGTKFYNPYCTRLPSDISLPALKVLLLHSVWFEGNQLSDVFLAACPALEDLTVKYYGYNRKFSYVISSKTIKKLSVTYNCDYRSDFFRIISFHTPNVVDFYYSDYLRNESPKCHLDSLSKATLDLHLRREVQNGGADVTDLISEIRNVKTLHLTISDVELISVFCKSKLPVFNNLIDLVFSSKKEGWEVLLPLLLERSPNLKTLVLSIVSQVDGMHQFIRIPPNNQIKMLRIMQYQGSAHELKHLRHFLLNMECLEVVQVYVAAAIDDPKKMQLKEDLLKLPTASSNLKICCKGGLPVFNNLVHLVFSSKKEGWEVLLPLLLERSPNLKTLVLSDLDSFKGRRHQFTPIPPNNQIKMLRIMEYQGYESDLKRLWHFLLNMKCLEVVQVYVVAAMNDPKKMQLREDLLKLPAASSKLKIQVV